MRIGYVHYVSEGGGAHAHVDQFVRAARDLGIDVDVLAPPRARPRDPSAGGDGASRAAPRLLARYLHEPKALLRNLPRCHEELAFFSDRRPDVLLVRTSLLTVSYLWTARRLGLPVALEVNAPVLESTTYKRQYAHLPWLPTAVEGLQLRTAGAVAVVSTPLKSYLVERHGVDPEKLVVVPNGADGARFRPDLAPDAERPPGHPVVGFVGSFQEFHGIDTLVGMIRRVAAARPQTGFLLVGDGGAADAARTALAHLGSRVRFIGAVPHARVPALVNALDIGVLPDTAFYCSPLKVVEWMAAGRAIVAPAYECLRDILADGVDGVLFPPRDDDALAAAVIGLIDAPERRAVLGESARRRAVASLSWDANARAMAGVCRSAIARHEPGPPAR